MSRENRISLKGFKYRTDVLRLCFEKITHVSTIENRLLEARLNRERPIQIVLVFQ